MLPANDTLVYSNARAYPLVPHGTLTTCAVVPYMTISIVNGVNPLQTTLLELGIVSGRVALLLRSAEIQPVFGRFSLNGSAILPPFLVVNLLLGGLLKLSRPHAKALTNPHPLFTVVLLYNCTIIIQGVLFLRMH